MENKERIKDKVEFFWQEKIRVHVKLLDRTFLNGFIEKKLREGVYWFIDEKLNGVYLFLKDIFEVKEWKELEG